MADAALAPTDGAGGSGAVTVGEATARGTAALRATSDTARLDAELLLAHVLGVGRERLVLDRDDRLGATDATRFADLVARRAAGEPTAYLLGRRGFRRIELAVDPRVLIPRPETELLVEVALELLPRGASVVDVGTGSGAIALALADERPDLTVLGIDASPEAIEVARVNATHLALDVAFSVGDLLDGVDGVDGVLANLPYVADGTSLPIDVGAYEPPAALFGGSDGLDVIRRLIAQMRDRPVALTGLEIAPEQSADVEQLLTEAGFSSVETRLDLAGRPRVVVGRR